MTVLALEIWRKGSNVPSHQESLNEENGMMRQATDLIWVRALLTG